MAAATVSSDEFALDWDVLVKQWVNTKLNRVNSAFGQVVPFKIKVALATTNIDDANDMVRFMSIPAGYFLGYLTVTSTDMDTHATPTLAGKVVALDSADAEQFDVTGSHTGGQAGTGGTAIEPAAFGRYVGGLRLAWKTTTGSATPAAGTLTVSGHLVYGVMSESGPQVISY